jgi:hypothetical protein
LKPRSSFNFLRFLPGILISILAVFFLSKFINYEDLVKSFQLFSALDILIMAAIMIFSLVARGFAWKSLMEGMSFRDGFLIINEGYLFNNLIPRSGEIVRIFITSSLTKNDAFQAATAIFFERALDLLIAAGMFLSTLSLVLEMQWLRATAIWIIAIFSLMLVGVLAAAYFSPRIKDFLHEYSFKNEKLEKQIKPVLIRAIQGLTQISQPIKLVPAFFWIVVTWFFWVLLIFYAITRLSPGAPLWWALFTEGVVALGIALPSAPANLGVYEGTIVFALSVFGISSDIALGGAILLHVIQIAITVVFGVVGLFIHDFKLAQIIEKIQTKIIKKKITNQES